MEAHLPSLEPDHWLRTRIRDRYGCYFDHWRDHFELVYFLSQFPRNGRVLDFGCGTGHMSLLLTKYHTVIGYDIDDGVLKFARKLRAAQEPEVIERSDFSRFLPNKEEYDIVWMSHVMEHIPVEEWAEIFDRLHGVCLISVPFGNGYDDKSHVNHWYNADALGLDLAKTGAQISWIDVHDHDVIRARITV